MLTSPSYVLQPHNTIFVNDIQQQRMIRVQSARTKPQQKKVKHTRVNNSCGLLYVWDLDWIWYLIVYIDNYFPPGASFAPSHVLLEIRTDVVI